MLCLVRMLISARMTFNGSKRWYLMSLAPCKCNMRCVRFSVMPCHQVGQWIIEQRSVKEKDLNKADAQQFKSINYTIVEELKQHMHRKRF